MQLRGDVAAAGGGQRGSGQRGGEVGSVRRHRSIMMKFLPCIEKEELHEEV